MTEEPSTQNKNSRQEEFWAWFQEHEAKIWNIDKNHEKVQRLVSDAIHKVDPALAFEIGRVDEIGKRVFVISANGLSTNIPKVESLFLTAPEMTRWRVAKYRPRLSVLGQISTFGKIIRAEDIRFQVFNDGDRIGILLLFDNYAEAKRDQFTRIGFIFLDRALGEYDVMTRVGFVDFAGKESNFYPEALRLPVLPKSFDAYFKPVV